MEKRRAPGDDGITLDILEESGDYLEDILAKFFTKCLNSRNIPNKWNSATGYEAASWCWHGVAVAAAAVTCYYPSLRGGLVFDDIAALKDNRDIRPHSPLSNLFLHDFWGTPIHKEQSHKSYRPLTVLSFRWNYLVHGLDPWGYHSVNVILHAIVSLLYLRFCRQVLRAEDALVAAFLFAVHPIHTDAVASVVGRAELLSATFFLFAILSYWRVGNSEKGTAGKPVWSTVMLPVLLSALGTLCKEQALTSLVVCAASDLLILNKVPLSKEFVQCLLNFRAKTPPWYRSIVVRVRLLLAAFTLLLLLRMCVMGQHFPAFNRLDNPSSVAATPTRVLTYNHLMAVNAWLLLFPNPLCCDWSSESVPLVQSLIDPRNLGTFLLYILLFRLAHQAVGNTPSANVIRSSLLLMIVPFLPATNLFFPVGFVIAERVLYLPSMGFCMLVAYGRSVLRSKSRRRIAFNISLSFLLLFYSLKTPRRCLDWESEFSLYKSGIDTNPRNVKLLNNMGRLLEKWGQPEEALLHYITAVKVHPDDVTGYLNLGNAYTSLQRFQEAEDAYLKATSLLPKSALEENHSNRVTVQHLKALLRLATLISRNSSRLDEADRLYAQAVSLRRDYTEAYVGWGSLMLRTNRTREAEFVLGKALEQDGQDPNMLYNLGIVLTEQGKTSEALAFFDRALSLDPHHEPSLLASARLIQDEGLYQLQEVAFQRLRKVVEMGQADETVHFSLGMLAVKLGDHREAEQWLGKALEIKTDFPEALFNMALLLYDEGRPSEATEFLRSLLQTKQDHVKGLLLLGDINVNYMEDLETAEECYRSVLNLDPENYQSLHNLCVVYMKRRQLQRAVDCFRQALGIAPHVDYIQRHLQLTNLLLKDASDLDSEDSTTNGSDVLSDITKRLRHLQFNQ